MLPLLRLLPLLLLLPPPGSPEPPEPPGLPVLSPGAPPQTPDLLYADGLRAYAAGAWAPAVALLREALRSRAALGRARRDCGARCAAEPGAALPARLRDPWEPQLLRAALLRAECLGRCEARALGAGGAGRLRVGRALRDAFRRREPYNYLQRAYYQLKKLDMAAAAAHTFLVANPAHLQMREDMAKYRRMARIRPQNFRDLETPPYWATYDEGLELLGRQEAVLALPRLEEALQESLAYVESCRAGCEGVEEQQRNEEEEAGTGSQGGLYEAIAEHWIRVLQCRQHCVEDIATRPGRSFPVPDFLPSQLRWLHQAHAQVGNLSQALENVLSLLLFYPEDEAARKALEQYQAQLGQPLPSVGPREDIQHFIQRSLGEKQQLYYAMEHLEASFKDPDPWTPAAFIPEALREQLREDQEKRPWDHEPPQQKPSAHWKDVLLLEGVTLTQDASQLNGSERVMLDGLLTPAECGELLQLAKDATGARSGYQGRRSPHTPHERFEGLTVLKAAQLARAGAVRPQGAKLLLEASERARTLTQAYFSPERPLHLSFTHLVCRSAVEGEQEQRMDLSHAVHADNCVLDPDTGECWREPPAYTYRDYSGLLYLNDDFQGGDLFFTEPDALTVTAQVHPRCGRLVAFSSGGENPHGVWAVTRGRRCALALWHTWALEHREQERTEAQELLKASEEEGEEEEEDNGKDPSPEPPGRVLQGIHKAAKPSRVREEL
ncbi:prolyl 3-hydroxylase 3 [Erinaceus europaeus]|uniref:procollagen-proline 3-dioxygenase n=1 Tax=Erinaceus europaeus TaxID=9365 RepID=A0ABM3XBD4_ERIEU|nr:prolyl 3-hydroxylase 3 [Erinaceus europaeus]